MAKKEKQRTSKKVAATSANTKRKQEATPAIPNKGTSAHDREAAAAEAIRVIKEGLKTDKLQKEQGLPYMPQEWPTKFKPVLGPYRRFVSACGHFEVVEGDQSAKYTIHLRDSEAPIQKFEFFVRKAWTEYRREHPEGSSAAFVKEAEELVQRRPKEKVEAPSRKTKKGAGKGQAQGKKAGPGEAAGSKKKKKKGKNKESAARTGGDEKADPARKQKRKPAGEERERQNDGGEKERERPKKKRKELAA